MKSVATLEQRGRDQQPAIDGNAQQLDAVAQHCHAGIGGRRSARRNVWQ